MTKFLDQAQAFFDTCESGKGSDAVKEYLADGATFECDSPALTMKTLTEYVDWMKGLANTTMPGCSYELKSRTSNDDTVTFFAIFKGKHTGAGGPVEPTNKECSAPYVYVIKFNADGKITGMTKVWNSDQTFRELGWA